MATTVTPTPKPRKRNRQAIKRSDLRERLWPDSEDVFWNRTNNQGFTTIPRLLPLILSQIRRMAKSHDPSSVYLELWARVFDEGIVSINNEKDFAYAAGYEGTRAERTMRERLLTLRELGFIKAHQDGNRDFAHILLVNPIQNCVDLHHAGRIDPAWWAAFARRAGEIGADLPPPSCIPRSKPKKPK